MKKKIILGIVAICVVIGIVICIFPYVKYFFEDLLYKSQFTSQETEFTFEDINDTTFIEKDCYNALKLTIKNSEINDLDFMNLPYLRIVNFENCTYTGEPIDINNNYFSFITFDYCDYDFIKNFENAEVTNLQILRTELNDLTYIAENFKNINFLTLYLSNVKSMKGIQNITTLETLNLYGVFSEDIWLIKNLTNLKELRFSYLSVDDISFIKDMPLTVLSLDNLHRLRNLDFITEMPTLKEIEIYGCEMACSEELITRLNEMKNNSTNVINFEEDTVRIQKEIYNLVNTLVTDSMTDREKIEKTVTYVCDLMTYDSRVMMNELLKESGEDAEDDSVAAIISQYNRFALRNALNGNGVCLNYTALISALLNEMGINTYSINNANHIWNLVEIDGEYLWLDVTSIDTSSIQYESLEKNPSYLAPITDPNFVSQLFSFPLEIYDEVYYAFQLSKEMLK